MLLQYTLIFCIFLLCLFAAYYAILFLRPTLLPKLLQPTDARPSGYLPLPTSFADQIRSGFSSRYFDLEASNVNADDSREGLDAQGLAEVREIMRRQRKTFDQARLIRQERLFAANGVDRYGMPLDKRAVTRL